MTERSRALHREDPELVTWWGSLVECASAIARVERDGGITVDDAQKARESLNLVHATWYEMQPGDAVRDQALRLLRLHPLRAADALQLGAALEWAGSPPSDGFVTFDERLRAAAQREGFQVF
jgi:predicted nucleic acid-binding protein